MTDHRWLLLELPPNEYNFSFFQIFQALEHPEEAQKLKILQNLTIIQRENFMNFILNGTWKNYVEPKKEIGDQLSDYELTVAQAAIGGIDMATKTPIFQWSYIQSVFFTSTILTTIGKWLTDLGCQKIPKKIANGLGSY